MLELLIYRVSTRHHETVLPELAQSVGVPTSKVSREAIEEVTKQLRALAEESLKELDQQVLYLDRI